MQNNSFTIYRYTINRKRNLLYPTQDDLLQQFKSEQHIFDNKLLVHLPQSHLTKKNISKRSLPILETHKNEDLLACTSKTSFNVALDNVLFVSTLEGCWTRSLPTPIAMKRQVSLSYPKEREIIFHSIPRRHSHPEPSFPLSLVDDSRRLSTEPVRRISSESTTATSSVSSLEDIEKAYDESKMIQDDHHSKCALYGRIIH